MNSTPSMPVLTMCATALPPPPPTPMTLITADSLKPPINSNICCTPLSFSPFPKPRSKIHLEPRLHPAQHAPDAELRCRRLRPRLDRLLAVEQQPDPRRMDRIADDVGEPLHVLRRAETHRHVEDLLGQLHCTLHLCAAAGEHDAGGNHFLEPG